MTLKIFTWLSPKQRALFDRLNTPQKIQDFLNKLPQNFELDGETCYSPKMVMEKNTAHCIEGALFAAAVLSYHGRRPLVMHLSTKDPDFDHVITLFKEGGYWGAISKTNHAVLRYRDPVYKTPRELAMSYFNEYFLNVSGIKTMTGYTNPVDLFKIAGTDWMSEKRNLWGLNDMLFDARHFPIAPKKTMKKLRTADKIETKVLDVPEQKEPKRPKKRIIIHTK